MRGAIVGNRADMARGRMVQSKLSHERPLDQYEI
jgi:hypothetical protein